MKSLKDLTACRIVDEREMGELNSVGTVLEHKKTGVRVFLVLNDDENRALYIGFRTLPSDDTGVPRILEHNIPYDSDKLLVKDPFVELVKGPLNTFLNVMTYPYKTVYPIASYNDRDFQDLADVYMDAILHPNIYNEKKISMQEGWYYKLESEDSPVVYNDVVYNKIRGTFSSPESVLDRYTQRILFLDICYGFEPDGGPKPVPDLTYEAFLDFHRTYYHPFNSFIYFYDDMDMAKKLEWLDEAYLSHYDKREADSHINIQKPLTEPRGSRIACSTTEGESEENASYLSVGNVVRAGLDPKSYLALQILEYTLLDAPDAPSKRVLLDVGIGHDILGGYNNGILRSYSSVVAKDVNEKQKGEFPAVVKGTLRKLAENRINKKSLLAGLNYFEFRCWEAGFGTAPKGLMYGLQLLDSWLYDGDPMMHLEYQETFDFLKKAVEEGYSESPIRGYLLDNPFEAVIVVSPKRNLAAKEDAAMAKKLAEYKAGLSTQEVKALVKEMEELENYQDTPSPSEELERIPMFSKEDIDMKAEEIHWKEHLMNGILVFHQEMFTSGIGYLKVLFNTGRVLVGNLSYVEPLESVLGYVDTENFIYSSLTSEIHSNFGGISFNTGSCVDLERENGLTGTLITDVWVLHDRIGFRPDMLVEILTRSELKDEKRLGKILREAKSRPKIKLGGTSHSAAVTRVTSYFLVTTLFNDRTGGAGFCHFLEDVVRDYEKNSRTLIGKLKGAAAKLFIVDSMLANVISNGKKFTCVDGTMEGLMEALPRGSGVVYPYLFEVGNRNEGLKTVSQVNYVARCGDFKKAGFSYTGVLRILKVISSYNYLWINLWVKDDVYGCINEFGMPGEGYFMSYRDPNLAEMDQVYEGIVDYLENFLVNEGGMAKYVIGIISGLDMPSNSSGKGVRTLPAYLSHVSNEMLQKEKDQVLDVRAEDIRKLAGVVSVVSKTGSFCMIGDREKTENYKKLSGEIKNPYHG